MFFARLVNALSLAFLLTVVSALPVSREGPDVVSREIQLAKRFDNVDITFYDPGLGACGLTNTNADAVVALSPAQFGVASASDKCGKTITITANGKTTTATVIDKCIGCTGNSIDVSPSVFQALAPLDSGRIRGSWVFN